MSTQWTEEDPGAGSKSSLTALASHLGSTSSHLDTGKSSIKDCLGIFPDNWSGLAAAAAKTQIDGINTRVDDLVDAAAAVKKALNVYADELEEIKSLANVQISLRDAAKEKATDISFKLVNLQVSDDHVADLKKREKLEVSLKEANEDSDEAVDCLRDLAKRRQTADHAILESLRAVIAENWDLPPEDYPSDRSWDQQVYYDYDMSHFLGFSTEEYTAKELMDLFKKYPSEIFPFLVKGDSSGFQDGAIFELSDTLPGDFGGIETGRVVVTTTDTSVKFTVVSDGYFDGPGSTIEFSIVERGGQFYLQKVAEAEKVQAGVAQSASGGAFLTWQKQADNFKNVVNKYGK